MKSTALIGAVGAAGAVIALGQLTDGHQSARDTTRDNGNARVASLDTNAPATERGEIAELGGDPDVIVFQISGTFNSSQGGIRVYSFGTTSCNIGTAPLAWFANTNQHPVIGQNVFRLAPGQNGHGRFEQLGQSWLKHGFCALDQSQCGSCQGTGCPTLGVGCSDPYTAGRNAGQFSAGPKWQVNSTTGFFPYPFTAAPFSGNVARRLQMDADDLIPAQNPGARYFGEAQYICPDDNATVNLIRAANNVSWRELSIASSGSLAGYIGSTQTQAAGIYAWRAADPAVKISWVAVPSEGSLYVGSRAYDNGDGTWDYEYAVQNLDFDRSVARVTIPVSEAVDVTNPGFNDVHYHSGDGIGNVNFSNADWTYSRSGDEVSWEVPSGFGDDPSANAIRWGTLYNFRFTADIEPDQNGDLDLGFFKPGGSNGIGAGAVIPTELDLCPADIDGDGMVAFGDVLLLLAAWGNCFDCPEDINNDLAIDFADLLILLASWGDCP